VDSAADWGEIKSTTAILKGEPTGLADGEEATVYFECCGPPSYNQGDFRTGDGITRTDKQTLEEAGEFTEPLSIEVDELYLFRAVAAVGVSFADLGLEDGFALAGFTVPVLAAFMTVAISIHDVPEGTAISIPLRAMGVSE